MTDEERLEESIRAIKSNWPDERYSMLRDALDYVISEAERVHELERELKKEKKEHKKTRRHFNGHRRKTSENWRAQRATQNRNSQLENVLEQFRDQNKRYREVIEQLYNFDGDVQAHSALADMLCGELLEGEE